MKKIIPMITELDVKLRDVESGELNEAAKHQVMQSICRTLRAYLRTEYGLKEENYIAKFTETRGQVCRNNS